MSEPKEETKDKRQQIRDRIKQKEIKERVRKMHEGLARARAKAKAEGRPFFKKHKGVPETKSEKKAKAKKKEDGKSKIDGNAPMISKEKWSELYELYKQHPTATHLMEYGGIGRRVARRAIYDGWPHLRLLPFIKIPKGKNPVHYRLAQHRRAWEEDAVAKGEAARMAAEQASAARISMAAALKGSQLANRMAEEMISKLDAGDTVLPDDITPKIVTQIISALNTSTEITKRAIEIEKMRAGEPEEALGIQIGIMLERCSDDELTYVCQTGSLPTRIVDQRKAIVDALEASAEVVEAKSNTEVQETQTDKVVEADEADEADETDETVATVSDEPSQDMEATENDEQ